ncbi:MAG TPA: PAS domain S-box protein [Smithellaceae bacterium]|nr:PAS domain S-box protein [Smithellaceae bacterium]HRV45161.1 PAS domain S-box protein [Smithellaceae bacterium]
MPKPLNVLMIEDSEDDALLLTRALKKNGYEPNIGRVQTARDMSRALESAPWDIILCDFHMPAFSGTEAIDLLKKTGLDIPLIVVSGAIGEETALDCIHRGASDYIMKGNLTRLGMAVQRGLEEKAMRGHHRQDEEALRRSEEKYRTILESIGDGYFETDLAGNFTFFNDALQRIWGYAKEELTGMNYRKYTDARTAKLLHQLYSQTYQTGNPGKVMDYEIIRKDGERLMLQQSFTLLKDSEGAVIGFRGIVRDVSHLKKLEREREETLEKLRQALESTIHAMAVTVESRDPYTAGHQRRVADLAYAMAVEMGLEPDRINGLRMASLIHDLGKISIPTEILTKPTKLTNIEFEIVKTHAQAGYEILKDIVFPWPIARIVLEHHEKMDGSGYPQHLKGDELLPESKILTVADVVEAMASHRPYRPSLSLQAALEEITRNRGILYDTDAVAACLTLFEEKRFSFAI